MPRRPSAETSLDETRRVEQVYEAYELQAAGPTRWSLDNPGNQLIVEERERVIRSFLSEVRGPVLDLGCGAGGDAPLLHALGAHPVVGVDLQWKLLQSRPFNPSVLASATFLPFADCSFELVVMSTLLSSVLNPALRDQIAREVRRVLRPGASALVYDVRVRNPSNPNIRPVLLRDLERQYPGYSARHRGLTVIPQLARRLPKGLLPTSYAVLSSTRLLHTHRLTLLTKPQ